MHRPIEFQLTCMAIYVAQALLTGSKRQNSFPRDPLVPRGLRCLSFLINSNTASTIDTTTENVDARRKNVWRTPSKRNRLDIGDSYRSGRAPARVVTLLQAANPRGSHVITAVGCDCPKFSTRCCCCTQRTAVESGVDKTFHYDMRVSHLLVDDCEVSIPHALPMCKHAPLASQKIR